MRASTVLLLVLALSGAGLSTAFWLELRAERALNADLTARLNAATTTPVTAPEPGPVASQTAEPPAVVASVVASAASTPAPTEAAAAKADRASTDYWQARQRKLMSDPR